MTRTEYLEHLEKLINTCPDPWSEDAAADAVWDLAYDLGLIVLR